MGVNLPDGKRAPGRGWRSDERRWAGRTLQLAAKGIFLNRVSGPVVKQFFVTVSGKREKVNNSSELNIAQFFAWQCFIKVISIFR